MVDNPTQWPQLCRVCNAPQRLDVDSWFCCKPSCIYPGNTPTELDRWTLSAVQAFIEYLYSQLNTRIAGSVGSVSTQHLQQDKSELHSVLHRFPSLVHLITLMPSNRKGERVAGLPQSMARVSVWQVNFSDLCRRVALICRHRYQILHRLLTRLSELCMASCSSVFWRENFFFQTSFCYLCFICRLSLPSGATFAFVPEQVFLIFENVHLSNDITCWSSR